MAQELLKCRAEIKQVAAQIKRLEETHGASDFQTFCPGQFARMVIIKQHGACLNFLREENGAELTYSQSIFFLGCQQARSILK